MKKITKSNYPAPFGIVPNEMSATQWEDFRFVPGRSTGNSLCFEVLSSRYDVLKGIVGMDRLTVDISFGSELEPDELILAMADGKVQLLRYVDEGRVFDFEKNHRITARDIQWILGPVGMTSQSFSEDQLRQRRIAA